MIHDDTMENQIISQNIENQQQLFSEGANVPCPPEKFGQRAFAQPSLHGQRAECILGKNERKHYTKNDITEPFEKKSYKYYDVCNNCGKQGHTFKQCKNPITSFGVIVFRINPLQQREYLMIRRKDTLGYIDFMRGKYSASNQKYILNMIQQMTVQEKYKLKNYSFDELWRDLWLDGHRIDISHLSDDDIKNGQRADVPCSLTNTTNFSLRNGDLRSQEKFGQMDEVLHTVGEAHLIQLDAFTSEVALPPEKFGQRAECLQQLTQKVTSSPEEFGYVNRILPEFSEEIIMKNGSISEDSIFQSYKQEEMNSRDKFIYLTTKYIKDISHQSNLSPYIVVEGRSPSDQTQLWEQRKDNGMVSILHYLIELSMDVDIHAYSEGRLCEAWSPEEYDISKKDLSEGVDAFTSFSASGSSSSSETTYIQGTLPAGLSDIPQDKYDMSNIMKSVWTEPEWGFPKGRRNFQEKDYDCALREMTEETGYPLKLMKNIKNILPFDEIFLGSNYKSYKHRYYLMYMNYEDSLVTDRFDKSEVSMMRWKTYDECLSSIRPYNLEKKRLIKNIDTTLSNYIGTVGSNRFVI